MTTFRTVRTVVALAVMACATISPGTSRAMLGGDVFVVAPVPVNATSSSAMAARSSALAEGQAVAWRRLLARMAFADDVAALAALASHQIADLVRGYEVLWERTSPVRYVAELSVTFDRDAVRRLLFAHGIAFAETPSRPVLVIPVLIRDDTTVLWEDPNPWRAAWQTLPPSDGLVPLLLPYGDLADIRDLSAEQALQGDEVSLRRIAERYGALDVVVALAAWRTVADAPRLDIVIRRHGGVDVEETVIDSVTGQAATASSGPMAAAVHRVVETLGTTWKRAAMVQPGTETQLTAVVPIEDFAQWLSVRARLSEIGILTRAELLRLSRHEARMRFRVQGDVTLLREALRQHGLDLRDGTPDPVVVPYGAPDPVVVRHGAIPPAPPVDRFDEAGSVTTPPVEAETRRPGPGLH